MNVAQKTTITVQNVDNFCTPKPLHLFFNIDTLGFSDYTTSFSFQSELLTKWKMMVEKEISHYYFHENLRLAFLNAHTQHSREQGWMCCSDSVTLYRMLQRTKELLRLWSLLML